MLEYEARVNWRAPATSVKSKFESYRLIIINKCKSQT